MFVIALVGLGSKLFLNLGCSQVDVHGLPTLLDAFEQGRKEGRGVITGKTPISDAQSSPTNLGSSVSNHISVSAYFCISEPLQNRVTNANSIVWTILSFGEFFLLNTSYLRVQ